MISIFNGEDAETSSARLLFYFRFLIMFPDVVKLHKMF